MDEIKIEYLDIEEIVPYENNPRLNDDAVEQVANSIKEFGFKVPIVIDENNVIVTGHTRHKASKSLGLTKVPCIRATDLTPEQIKAFRLADNKVSELAQWDLDKLQMELDDIEMDMSDFGFELEIDEIGLGVGGVNSDTIPEEPKNPIAKLGDIYELGEHRLICGDCTDINILDKLMNGKKADLVFTDPPYLLETKGGCKGKVGESLKKQGDEIEFISDFEPSAFLNVLPTLFAGNMNAYIFCNKELLPDYLNWCKEAHYSWNVLIWKKPSAIPIADSHRPDIEYLLLFRKNAIWNNGANANYSRCLEYSREQKTEENGKHPTIKPVDLIMNELLISSQKESIVVDLFGGSGSTLIACEETQRKCYMCELDPKYIDVIISRWENLTGKKAKLLN